MQRDPHALGHAELAAVDRGLAREHPQQRRLARAVAPRDRHPFAALQLERHPAQQRLPGHVLVQVGCDQYGHRLLIVGIERSTSGDPSGQCSSARSGSIHRAMRRLLATFTSSVLLLLVLAPAALAENDGRGFYGATNDKVVTNAGFILIIFFPTFVFVMSMLQRSWRSARKRARPRRSARRAPCGAAAGRPRVASERRPLRARGRGGGGKHRPPAPAQRGRWGDGREAARGVPSGSSPTMRRACWCSRARAGCRSARAPT